MNAKLETQVRDQIVLLLAERPDYGLSLRDRLDKLGFHLGYEIYELLRKMERDGIVVSEERNEAPWVRGGHPRIYYALPKTADRR